MGTVLLTGAGFTRNWGGWLGDEVFEYLLGCPDLNGHMRSALWETYEKREGFEAAFSRLRIDADRRNLETIVGGMFRAMNNMLTSFEFQSDRQYSIANFLARFDAIFTLNFDLLLERHYLHIGVELAEPRKWAGSVVPGVRPAGLTPAIGSDGRRYVEEQVATKPEQFDRSLQGSVQPYFKLHGSTNWGDERGRMLVMGGGKEAAISGQPLLSWYLEHFRAELRKPETRLMVIGYSFSDDHVNSAIVDAAKAGPLKLFIVDPQGVDAMLPRSLRGTTIRPQRPPPVDVLYSHVIGASRRPLSQTFGNDHVEWLKFHRFFE